MSDGFDKEAEREKLREKFAEDEQQREHTQRMSELLLQGATMTNRHCDACGDPIFRHDGHEFCPTCHATDDGYAIPTDDETADDQPSVSDETADSREAPDAVRASAADHSAGPDRTHNSGGVSGSAGSAGADGAATNAAGGTAGPIGGVCQTDTEAPDPSSRQSASGSPEDTAVEREGTRQDTAGDIEVARRSLVRTLHRFAQAAERSDDPRRARERLEAAREAAEVLATLDR